MNANGVYPLRGVVQHYQWGGSEFLPALLQLPNTDQSPWAEYWLGVHPKGTASVTNGEAQLPLDEFLQRRPALVGPDVDTAYGALPFLFKILDVRSMLSIQLHPTRAEAGLGFAREEAAGIPPLADHRSYKDKNHKPEVMVALSDFWLLHGFRDAGAIAATLEAVPAWRELLPTLRTEGVAGLYARVMRCSDEEVFRLLDPLYRDLRERSENLNPANPDYWAWQAFLKYSNGGRHDRGVFSIYWFNLVHLETGEGIFQAAGIPHAYLRGVNVELMANSDNVLRGGLTPKHVDVDELLRNINFSAVHPAVLPGTGDNSGRTHYPVPISDFALNRYELQPGQRVEWRQRGPAILLATAGTATVNQMPLTRGSALLLSDGANIILTGDKNKTAVLFIAGVGEDSDRPAD